VFRLYGFILILKVSFQPLICVKIPSILEGLDLCLCVNDILYGYIDIIDILNITDTVPDTHMTDELILGLTMFNARWNINIDH
jgi:hypothetical protein